jgi:hypothetical protein
MIKNLGDRAKRGAKPLVRRVQRRLSPLAWQRALPLGASWGARRALLKGFKPTSYALYGLAHHDPHDYLPDTAFRSAADLNGPLAVELLHDKRRFFEVLSGEVSIPRVVAEVVHGRLEPVAEASCRSPEGLLAYLRAQGDAVFKPRRGQQGRGVFSVGVSGGEVIWDGTRLPLERLAEALGALDGYLITEKVHHAPYADAFPHAVNSARVMVVQDQDLGLAPFAPVAVQRFGAAGTGVTDNAARGGLYAHIHPLTGELSAAVRLATSFGETNATFDRHPDTGAPIRGVRVPEWPAVQRGLLELSRRHPAFRFIGWDVVVTEMGFSVLEGNVAPSLAVQVFYPYLKDPRLKALFRARGIV